MVANAGHDQLTELSRHAMSASRERSDVSWQEASAATALRMTGSAHSGKHQNEGRLVLIGGEFTSSRDISFSVNIL